MGAGLVRFPKKTNPWRSAPLEAGAGSQHLPLQILRKSSVRGWSLTEAFPLQILWERRDWRLELVWGTFLYKSFQKDLIGGWSWLEASSFTNPLRKAWLEAGASLRHFPLQILWERLRWRLELVRGIFLYKSFKKSSFGCWSLFEALSFTNPLRKAWLEAGAGLKHLPLQII